MKLLNSSFYQRDTVTVAEQLLGQVLVRQFSDGSILSGKIVEAEAYLGAEDQACHTFGGRKTPRTLPMYGPPGTAYIYLIYGMYNCFNVVTGNGEAILIRALEPLAGFSKDQLQKKVLSGPGKLCQNMDIHRDHNSIFLFEANSPLIVCEAESLDSFEIVIGERVGISNRCEDSVHYPLRFGINGNSYLSNPKIH